MIHFLTQFSTQLVRLLPSKGDRWELLNSNFKVGIKLGEGNYGQVYKGALSVEVATAPAKRYITTGAQKGNSPYTVAIKLLKGALASCHVDMVIGKCTQYSLPCATACHGTHATHKHTHMHTHTCTLAHALDAYRRCGSKRGGKLS